MNAALYDGMQINILIFVIDYDIISEKSEATGKGKGVASCRYMKKFLHDLIS